MNRVFISAVLLCAVAASEAATGSDSIIGRPYKSFDVTAYCSYNSFHPSQYLTDNNWDILCAFTQPGPRARLDSLGIKANTSQLRLLEVGGLLKAEGGGYRTKMPIFGNEATKAIRRESKEFADSIFPSIEPDIRALVGEFESAGWSRQSYSLVFSYLLDGYIWDEKRIVTPTDMTDHGTWTGAFWAMYDSRPRLKTGTNGFGPLHVNWTDSLGYYPGDKTLIQFARELSKTGGRRIENSEIAEKMSAWGLADSIGNISVPVVHYGSGDSIDALCCRISTALSDAVKSHCVPWAAAHGIESHDIAEVIFYHEVMWDLLDLCEKKGIVTMPDILLGKEVGKSHFGDIIFIVVDSSGGE